ncbi:MAG: hypothetical protein HUU01_11195 [Saprospiraceae bacterium]|nr:hypothetical protein [Saprospiraceae bacterium]
MANSTYNSATPPPPEVLRALMAVLDAEAWTPLVWNMHHTARSGLSFSIFQNILQLLGIESGVYQIDFDTLLEVQPIPGLLYSDAANGFVLLKKIEPEGITCYGRKDEEWFTDRKVLEKGWDGKILALGEISVQRPIQKAICTFKKNIPRSAGSLVLEIAPDNAPRADWCFAGKIAPATFAKQSQWSFECTIPGPFSELTLHFLAIDPSGQGETPAFRVHLPVAFERRWSILRFYFSENSVEGPKMLGVKGSLNRLFQIELLKNDNIEQG